MKFYIRNMVCNRCKMVVNNELQNLGLHPISVQLGEVVIKEKSIEFDQLQLFKKTLTDLGFELMGNGKSLLIEKIKNEIIKLIYEEENQSVVKLSNYLEVKIGKDYTYLSNLFSVNEGMTIEQYSILQKTERVKELLVYNELTISEIAFYMNYSSVSHLSKQFKKTTGLTPTHFKKSHENSRTPIDEL